MSEIALDYLAFAIAAAFYSFGVTPMLGSLFDEFGSYTSHLKIGMTINAVFVGLAALIFSVMWSILRILE